MDPSRPDSDLTYRVKKRAIDLGFARVGVARAQSLTIEADRLRAWIAAGRHGSMSWMSDSVAERSDPRHAKILADARSVLVVAAPYARPEPDVVPLGRIARYARGRDYHNVLLKRVRKLAALLRKEGHSARASVDALPVMERAWAERAGIGFVGKNCCIIVPGLGSFVLLATVITSADLVPDAPMPERCGDCRACLDACPTRAFVAPRELDARRCISYLTIEHEGPIPADRHAPIGDRLFGCDTCQDVCPFNRTAPPPESTTTAFASDPRREGKGAAEILTMSNDELREMVSATPLARPGVRGLKRNAAIVIANTAAAARGHRR